MKQFILTITYQTQCWGTMTGKQALPQYLQWGETYIFLFMNSGMCRMSLLGAKFIDCYTRIFLLHLELKNKMLSQNLQYSFCLLELLWHSTLNVEGSLGEICVFRVFFHFYLMLFHTTLQVSFCGESIDQLHCIWHNVYSLGWNEFSQ